MGPSCSVGSGPTSWNEPLCTLRTKGEEHHAACTARNKEQLTVLSEWATEFPSLSRRQCTTRQRWPSPGALRKRPATCRGFSLCSIRMLWSFNFRAIDRRHTPQLRLRPSKGFFSPPSRSHSPCRQPVCALDES